MTEYIIIVALIAIAAIGVYTAFGGIVRGQTGVIAHELAGTSGGEARGLVTTAVGTIAGATAARTLSDFETATGSGGGGAPAPAP